MCGSTFVIAVAATACIGDPGELHPPSRSCAPDQRVASVAGFTRIATTTSYLLVVNVLPAEPMYTPAEVARNHPPHGELALVGPGNGIQDDSRHVEVHIYSRGDGLPTHQIKPTITVLDRSSGRRIAVPATMMRDLDKGDNDLHFGNNVVLSGDRWISVEVAVGSEKVTVDGFLDDFVSAETMNGSPGRRSLRRRMRNASIGMKLAIGFGVLTLIAALAITGLLVTVQRLDAANERMLGAPTRRALAASALRAAAADLRAAEFSYVIDAGSGRPVFETATQRFRRPRRTPGFRQ